MREILIEPASPTFRPEHFVVCKFYETQYCFCWADNSFIGFPFYFEYPTNSLLVTIVPGYIKDVKDFDGSVFFIVYPNHIYELTATKEFSLVSGNAIGFNVKNNKIFVPIDTYLHLGDLHDKTIQPLLNLRSNFESLDDFAIFSLSGKVDPDFKNMLWYTESKRETYCIIGYKTELYVVLTDIAKHVYTSNNNILNIFPIMQGVTIFGLIVNTTSTDIIMIYVYNEQLCFDVFYVEAQPKSICAGVFEYFHDLVWIAYSSDIRQYYMRINISTKTIERSESEDKHYTCLRHHKNRTLLFLRDNFIMERIPLEEIEFRLTPIREEFIPFKNSIFQGLDVPIARIITKTKELRSLTEHMINEYRKLENLNLYCRKMNILLNYSWKSCRMVKNNFVVAQFEIASHLGVHVIVSIKTESQRVSCIQKLDKFSNTVKLEVPELNQYSDLKITFDLVAFLNPDIPWCIIRDFNNECNNNNNKIIRLNEKKTRFVEKNISFLSDLIKKKKIITMKILSQIKSDVRKEINVLL